MEIVVCGVPFGQPIAEEALRQVKDLGFTSVQIYTFWKEFEPEQDHFDWSVYDPQVELIGKAGLKYVPFLLMGPKYAAPEWWLQHKGHIGLRCLEHGRYSPIESVWNPAFRSEITRVLSAFADHYRDWKVIESVQPGICGDYGEAIFPVVGNWPGDYHTHRGFWCGGEDAVADFQRHLEEQYHIVDRLNQAWRTGFNAFSEITPFLRHHAPSRTAWFDMICWYRGAMTEYADFWMQECRRLFPDLPVYLCTGGMEEPEHGSSFASQARIAAKHQGGIRLTNEANRFYHNFTITAYAWSACRFYGAYLGLEPVGPMTERGVRARVFGSIAYGNRQIFHYYGNVMGEDAKPLPAAAALKDYLPLAGEREVPSGIAFFWPTDRAVLEGETPKDINDSLAYVRTMYPVSPVGEEMILDGALDRFNCLIMIGAETARRSVLERIADWVTKRGGLLLSVGRVRDIELEPVPSLDACFGILPDSEDAWGISQQHVRPTTGFPGVSALPPYYANHGWMGLDRDVEMITATEATDAYSGTRTLEVSAMFQKKWDSGGRGIFYCGPVSFQSDPEALFQDPGVLRALLKDVCDSSGITGYTLAEGEIARAEIDRGILVLRPDSIELIEKKQPS
jgi:hypothetical protein